MEARTADGSSALHLAARHGELDVANEILKGSEHLADAVDWKGGRATAGFQVGHQL